MLLKRISLTTLALFFVSVLAVDQCSSGPCCNVKTGLFKEKGSKCAKPTQECTVAASTCSGFSASCSYKNEQNGAECSIGVCLNGKCVSKRIARQVSEKAEEKKLVEKRTPKTERKNDAITQKTTSTTPIDAETKELHVKITAELEKAKTLLSSVTVEGELSQQALEKVITAVDMSLEYQATENAEQLALASSKIRAQLAIALTQLRIAAQGADDTQLELLEQVHTTLTKAEKNAKTQKKGAQATVSGRNPRLERELREKEAIEKANALIEEGLPVITRVALNAANTVEQMQEQKLLQLATEQLMNERKEKSRIIDEELRRVRKKAQAARVNSLRVFEKQESKDEDTQELKQAAKNIVESDPAMKMRYFVGLTDTLIESNREKFAARDRKKIPNEEKYKDMFTTEHEIVRRNEDALMSSGYFGEKYGRMNITLPEVSSETAPSLTSVLFGETGGMNWVAIALFIVAGVCVVFIIFAIIKKATNSSDHKKYDDDDEDDYEKF